MGGPGNNYVVLSVAVDGRGVACWRGGGGVTLGDWRGGTLEAGEGVGGVDEGICGLIGFFQLWKRSRGCHMTSSWVSMTAEGVSFRALERNWRACVIRSV